MSQPAANKKFVFNDKIDSGFLFSLYEEDYAYILEVFESTLSELDGATSDLTNAFHAGSPSNMKRAAHKLKPLFGFTGLLFVQEAVGDFETQCSEADWLEVLERPYQRLLGQIDEAKQIILTEHKRLLEFSAS